MQAAGEDYSKGYIIFYIYSNRVNKHQDIQAWFITLSQHI